MASVTKTRSCQTTGLEWPRPGSGVRQRMLSDFFASHVVGSGRSSAMPDAFGPRNDGQFWAYATADKQIDKPSAKTLGRTAPVTFVVTPQLSPGTVRRVPITGRCSADDWLSSVRAPVTAPAAPHARRAWPASARTHW